MALIKIFLKIVFALAGVYFLYSFSIPFFNDPLIRLNDDAINKVELSPMPVSVDGWPPTATANSVIYYRVKE